MYFARLSRPNGLYTKDPIIARYKFTNAYRAADRVSQYLIRHVIYGDAPALTSDDILFRILLFKMFNKIETWELLERELGPIRLNQFNVGSYGRVLSNALAREQRIYSAAYIAPSGSSLGHARKHLNHLTVLEMMMRGGLARRVASASCMSEVFTALLEYPMIGKFLAYQFTVDINYSELTDFDEDDFVVAGPGAIDGIRKAFTSVGSRSCDWIIRFTRDMQDSAFASLGVMFRDLFGRPLRLIDCQNLFCEVDKYSRVAHPQLSGQSGRTRIKQRFAEGGKLPQPWFPPKWGINDSIPLFPRCGARHGVE